MATRLPNMKSIIHSDSKHRRFVVVVEHSMYQSYSKAVFPKVKRDMKKYLEQNHGYVVTYIDSSDLGTEYTRGTEELPADQRRVISLFYITY